MADDNLDPTPIDYNDYKSILFYPAQGGFHSSLVFLATDIENVLLMKYTPENGLETIVSNPKQ